MNQFQLKPVKFTVINEKEIPIMEDIINQLLKDGWMFHGDMKVLYVPETGADPVSFVQAMVKVEPVAMPRPAASNILVPQ